MNVGRFLFAAVGLVMAFSAPARAQSADPPPEMLAADPRQVALMDATLAKMHEENQFSGGLIALNLFDGVSYLALGTGAALTSEGDLAPPGSARVAFTAGTLLVGTHFLVRGVRMFVAGTEEEERLARFRRQRANGTLDTRALVLYEGELQDAAALARTWRLTHAWTGVGMAAAGQTLIGLTAASDAPEDDDSRVIGYLFGGLYLVVGALIAYGNFTTYSPTERLWRRYQLASPPEAGFEAQLMLSPWGSQGFVLGSVGRF